ncbi:MAG TPA: hypothetical protein VI356_22990 [Myxococcales bacterium]
MVFSPPLQAVLGFAAASVDFACAASDAFAFSPPLQDVFAFSPPLQDVFGEADASFSFGFSGEVPFANALPASSAATAIPPRSFLISVMSDLRECGRQSRSLCFKCTDLVRRQPLHAGPPQAPEWSGNVTG